MDAQQIAKFLAKLPGVPQHARDTIIRSHSGRWPMWRARSMKLNGREIVEVAEWCRCSHGDRYVVLHWSATQQTVGVKWRSCGTLREAIQAD